MITILMRDTIGDDIRTRIFFRRDIESMINSSSEYRLDFSGVVFITRSVADEIYNIKLDYPKLEVVNLQGEAKKMYDVVARGRLTPRVYEDTHFENVRLNNIEETIRYFEQNT